jgi:hypothetical protein
MIDNSTHRDYGTSIDDWIAMVPKELSQDAVSLVQILSAGQLGFELKGVALNEYIARNIRALLNAGAIPVIGSKNSDYAWVAQKKYGTQPDEIITAILTEWQASNGDEMYPWGVWFARPIPNSNYVKMD